MPKRKRPSPALVKGPNTWRCEDCGTAQPYPEDGVCKGTFALTAGRAQLARNSTSPDYQNRLRARDGNPCGSEDIFDMNEAAWPCYLCGDHSVTRLDMERQIACHACWKGDVEDWGL